MAIEPAPKVTRADLEAALRRYGASDEARVIGWAAELAAILTTRWRPPVG